MVGRVIILLLNVPLSRQHVLLGSVAALYQSPGLVSGRGIAVHRGMGAEQNALPTVGEDGPETGRWMALVN